MSAQQTSVVEFLSEIVVADDGLVGVAHWALAQAINAHLGVEATDAETLPLVEWIAFGSIYADDTVEGLATEWQSLAYDRDEPDGPEPDIDDGVVFCPDCEQPLPSSHVGGPCARCERERAEDERLEWLAERDAQETIRLAAEAEWAAPFSAA